VLESWRQGEVFQFDDQSWVVVSRSCDIVRSVENLEKVYCVPISPQTDSRNQNGRVPRWVHVPDHNDGSWCGDMHAIRAFLKEDLKDLEHEAGTTSGDGERRVRRQAGRYFGRPSHIDGIERTLEPLMGRVVKRHNRDSAEGRITSAITDLRIEVDPEDLIQTDETTDRAVKLLVVVGENEMPFEHSDESISEETGRRITDARQNPSRVGAPDELGAIATMWAAIDSVQSDHDMGLGQWLLRQYVEAMVDLCTAVAPVSELTHELLTEEDMSFARVKNSAPLSTENLSFAQDRQGIQ
jgi:hypothetical protein